MTRAHSYTPKLQAPGQPSNEGRICTALTLSLYSPESHDQGDMQLAGAPGGHSALHAGLQHRQGGGRSAKSTQAQRAPWEAPSPHRQSTRRPDNLGVAEPCPGGLGSWAPRARPPALLRQPPNPTLQFGSGAGRPVRRAAFPSLAWCAQQWGAGASIDWKESRGRLPRSLSPRGAAPAWACGPPGRTPH